MIRDPARPSDNSAERSWVVRPTSWWRPSLIALGFWIVLLPLAWLAPRLSGNVWSRYMTVESIVERGTQAIERSPMLEMSGSPDYIKVGRHFYSDKPPVLSVLAALPYLPLKLYGLRFAASPQQFTTINGVLVATFVGLASAATLFALRCLLQTAPVSAWVADLLTLVFGFGSLLFSYGVTFNNHSVAAGLLTVALAVAVLRPQSVFLPGLLTGLAATIDLPAGGAMLLGLGILVAARSRDMRSLTTYLAGCAGPLVLHALLQIAVTGSPLPAEMTPEVFAFEGSYWSGKAGRWVEPGPRWRFGIEFLFGPQGWLTVTPVLIFGLVAGPRIVARRGDPLRPHAAVILGVTTLLLAYYIWGVRRTDYSGLSFGTRHLLAISPGIYWLGVVGLARLRSRVAWSLFIVCWIIGAVYAFAGMRDPWSRIEGRSDSGLVLVKPLTIYPWTSYRR